MCRDESSRLKKVREEKTREVKNGGVEGGEDKQERRAGGGVETEIDARASGTSMCSFQIISEFVQGKELSEMVMSMYTYIHFQKDTCYSRVLIQVHLKKLDCHEKVQYFLSESENCRYSRWTSSRDDRSLERIVKQSRFKNLGVLTRSGLRLESVHQEPPCTDMSRK